MRIGQTNNVNAPIGELLLHRPLKRPFRAPEQREGTGKRYREVAVSARERRDVHLSPIISLHGKIEGRCNLPLAVEYELARQAKTNRCQHHANNNDGNGCLVIAGKTTRPTLASHDRTPYQAFRDQTW
ncbi:MAG: hypothetical protein E7Z99_05600 [Coriobacteriaceae bacterium]|nr:hypothetical protein [Coriobacteriaceae bacterium]